MESEDVKVADRNIELWTYYVRKILTTEPFQVGSIVTKDKLEIAGHVANGFIIGHDKQVFFEKQKARS